NGFSSGIVSDARNLGFTVGSPPPCAACSAASAGSARATRFSSTSDAGPNEITPACDEPVASARPSSALSQLVWPKAAPWNASASLGHMTVPNFDDVTREVNPHHSTQEQTLGESDAHSSSVGG